MFFVFVSFSSCRSTSPPRGRGRSGYFCHSDCGTGLCDFLFLLFGGIISPRPPSLRLWRYFGFSLFRRHVFATASPFQVIWRVVFFDVFSAVRDRPPFFPFLLGVPCRLRSLAIQRCGSGVLRSRIFDSWSCWWNRDFPEFPHISAYTSHQFNGIALNNLDTAGNYLQTGIGIVLVLLGRRILD